MGGGASAAAASSDEQGEASAATSSSDGKDGTAVTAVMVVVPDGLRGGDACDMRVNGRYMRTIIPPGLVEGDRFAVNIPVVDNRQSDDDADTGMRSTQSSQPHGIGRMSLARRREQSMLASGATLSGGISSSSGYGANEARQSRDSVGDDGDVEANEWLYPTNDAMSAALAQKTLRREFRHDLLILAPTMRHIFRDDLPETNTTYRVPAFDDLDEVALVYLRELIMR